MRSPTIDILAVFVSAMALSGQARVAHAQFVDRCEFRFRPAAGATIPSNAPGIAFERDAPARLASLELLGPGGEVVPTEAVEQVGAPRWSVKPVGSMSLGAHRLIADFASSMSGECPFDFAVDGGRRLEHSFSVGPESPLPSSLGAIVIEGPNSDPNSDRSIDVTLAISETAQPFLPLFAFTLRVNGVARVPSPEQSRVVGVAPRFQSPIFCGIEAGAPPGFVNEGDNTFRIEGALPGRDNPITAEVIATLSCNGPPRLRDPNAAPAPSANEASVSACGCELPGSSGDVDALLLTLPLLGLSTAWIRRRCRQRS